MANEFHKNLILDDIHAVPSRIYADITARDADTDFNTNSTNLYKDVVVISPLSTYRLMTTAPLFQELTNTTAGNVTTSDTLLATQLLLGNGGTDIVTEPDMTYDGFQLQLATINVISQLVVGLQTGSTTTLDTDLNLAEFGEILIDDTQVIATVGGDIVLKNIDVVDNITRDAIEAVIIDLPILASVGLTSGTITGPSGEWANDGFNAGPGDMFSINNVILLDGTGGVHTLMNIDALDATTEATILAISGIGNVTTADVLTDNRLLTGNGGSDIVIEPLLFWDGTVMGVGTVTPASRLHIFENTSFSGGSEGLTIEQDGSGDAKITLLLTGGTRFALGIDNTDGDKFKISDSGNFSAPDIAFTITPVSMLVGIGQPSPLTRLHVSTDVGDSVAVTTFESTAMNAASVRNFVGIRDPEGLITGNPGDHYLRGSGVNSGEFIFKAAATGTAGWEAVQTNAAGVDSVTTSDTLAAQQLLLGNGGTDIVTEPDLVWDGTRFGVRVASPETTLDINGETSDALRLRSGNASGFTLNQIKLSLDTGVNFTHSVKTRHDEFDQFSNAIDVFLWDADTDNPGDVGTLPVMSLKGDGKIGIGKTSPSGVVDILSLFGDTTPIIQMESASNAGTVKLRTGNRDPNAAVTGLGPDVYYADRGALSGTYENRSAGGDQVWLKRSVLPPEIIQLQNSTELDDLASGGIITISTNTTWHVRAPLTTTNRIVVNSGVFFHITGEFNGTASITYTGTGTFITSIGSIRIFAQLQLISSSTGTFIDQDGGGGLSFKESSLVGWDNLGAIINSPFFVDQGRFVNIGGGLTLTNNNLANVGTLVQAGTDLNGPLFIINTNNPLSVLSFTDVSALALGSTGSIFDLDTRINNNATITVNRCSVVTGVILTTSLLVDPTINSVADGSIATGTITAMADNGSGGTTISSTTTYFEDEEVTISGTTSYNGDFQIFNVVAGVSFDTITAFVADDATGSVDTVRLTLTLAGGHGIIAGDSLKIIDTNFYNGFETALNVATNDLTVNGIFISTNIGSIEVDVSLDQTDPRVSAFNNFGISDSVMVATGHVNDNSTAVGTIVNNTFTDLVFGTVGDALLANTTMERWRLVNELNGTFEYFGQEPFDGSITFDFTVESAGGTVDFRFKWLIDKGVGFVDLADNVESLVAVGSDAQSVTKTYPLAAVKGDLIKPQITRNSGTSGITVAYATVFAGG